MKKILINTVKSMDSNHLTMESLSLPKELYWEGKQEPTSPPSSELCLLSEITEKWLYDDNFANGLTSIEDTMELEENLDLSISEDLIIEFYDLKEEYLLDTKLHSLPQLLDYPNSVDVANPNLITKVSATNDLLHFGGPCFETAVLAQLTPPQSPPQTEASLSPTATTSSFEQQKPEQQSIINTFNENVNILNNVHPSSSSSPAIVYTTSAQNFNFNVWNNNHNNDVIEREAQIVDEIVNIRAQELDGLDNEDCDSQSSSLYSVSPSHAGSKTCSSITDEDWGPQDDLSYNSSRGSSPLYDSNNSSSPSVSSSKAVSKKRTRPYGRGIEDRKIRKKEQNKNAATRYRQKKKSEMETILGEEQVLIQRNEELKHELAERKHEAKYLRKLLREFYQNKSYK